MPGGEQAGGVVAERRIERADLEVHAQMMPPTSRTVDAAAQRRISSRHPHRPRATALGFRANGPVA